MKEFIEKMGKKGERRAAQVQSKKKMLEKVLLEPVPEPLEEKKFKFSFPEIGKVEKKVCSMKDVSFGYSEDRILFQNVQFSIDMDSRIGMLGGNGVGKTTLVKLIMGDIEPTYGYCERNDQMRIALFTQHHMDQLDLNLSAIEFLLQKFKNDLAKRKEADHTFNHEGYVRRWIGRFGLSGQLQTQKMRYLSGGQKSRVAFAILTWFHPHFLILDEPTNHLDMETITALIEAIKGDRAYHEEDPDVPVGKRIPPFDGGVLIISHDQHFLRQVGEEFWALTAGHVGDDDNTRAIKRFRSFKNAKKFSLQERMNQLV